VDILQLHEWTPVQTVRTIVLSLRSLFMDPNPNSPANRDAAKLYMENRQLYNETVKKNIDNLNKS
jgi:ubiquitin-conjugating enzyme E2 A